MKWPWRRVVGAPILALASSLLFWKVRIFDRGTNPTIEVGPIDLYVEHMPMAQYAFEELGRGHLPLWDPYQLCGMPFFAVPHVALFYPLHFFSFFVDAVTAVEVSFIMHMTIGGLGLGLLARRFALTPLGSAAAAVTFIWSGWVVFNNVLPGIFACMNWLPLTIFLIDRAFARERFAHAALIGAVTIQILIGASEVLVHTLYVGAGLTILRLLSRSREESILDNLGDGARILGCIIAAFLLAAPQLLPSIELVAESARGAEGMTFAEAVFGGIKPVTFAQETLGLRGLVTVGVLPILALPLAFGSRRDRFVSSFALILVVLAILLVTWPPAYRLYHSTPIIGSLFRRPTKFLDVYVFAQALVAGLALTRLHVMAVWPRATLWRDKGWLVCLGFALAAVVWSTMSLGLDSWSWVGGLILLLLFGAAGEAKWRQAAIAGLLLLQAATLFSHVGGTHVRPAKRPEIFHTHDALLESVRATLGAGRVYLSPSFFTLPGLTPKQGMLSRTKVSTDYEPLLTARYKRFFSSITPSRKAGLAELPPGSYELRADSNWTLVDLTASRRFIVSKGERAAYYMRTHPQDFRMILKFGDLQVFDRPKALPRAYVVGSARSMVDEDDVFRALVAPDFDPRRQILLEAEQADAERPTALPPDFEVEFKVDESEEVVLEVSSSSAGYLVLSDLFYPGWRAFDGNREIEIHRANYLFRAVEIKAGLSEIRFSYEPSSVRLGLWVGALTLISLVAGFVWIHRESG